MVSRKRRIEKISAQIDYRTPSRGGRGRRASLERLLTLAREKNLKIKVRLRGEELELFSSVEDLGFRIKVDETTA